MAIWIPSVTWALFTLTTGERVALQVEHEDASVVRGLELDPTGWPRERVWEIEPGAHRQARAARRERGDRTVDAGGRGRTPKVVPHRRVVISLATDGSARSLLVT